MENKKNTNSPYKGHRNVSIVVHPPKHFRVSVRRWVEWIMMSCNGSCSSSCDWMWKMSHWWCMLSVASIVRTSVVVVTLSPGRWCAHQIVVLLTALLRWCSRYGWMVMISYWRWHCRWRYRGWWRRAIRSCLGCLCWRTNRRIGHRCGWCFSMEVIRWICIARLWPFLIFLITILIGTLERFRCFNGLFMHAWKLIDFVRNFILEDGWNTSKKVKSLNNSSALKLNYFSSPYLATTAQHFHSLSLTSGLYQATAMSDEPSHHINHTLPLLSIVPSTSLSFSTLLVDSKEKLIKNWIK